MPERNFDSALPAVKLIAIDRKLPDRLAKLDNVREPRTQSPRQNIMVRP
jgi:hypothetical protein